MIQPHMMGMAGAPGGPGHGQPFPARAATGTGPAGVRSISPGAFSTNGSISTNATTMGTPTATFSSSPTPHAARGIQPRPLGTTISGTTLTIQQKQFFKIMSSQEEDELIRRCEDGIKQGQFNQTNGRLKPQIMAYRQRGIKFQNDKVVVSKNGLFSDLGDCMSSETVVSRVANKSSIEPDSFLNNF